MYDAIVIGGGPGGYAAAIRVSQLGGRAAVIEAGEIGGVCVNRGCIPTKVWQWASSLIHRLNSAELYGVRAPYQGLDLSALKARKDGVSGDIRMGMQGLLANNGIEVISGRAALKGPNAVEVEGRSLETRKIILATGGGFAIPDGPGLEDALMTTDEALDLTELPKTLLVWGADHIEVEMATHLRLFGARIVLATSESRLLPREDHDVSQRLTQSLRDLGVEVLVKRELKSARKTAGGFEITLGGTEEKLVEAERALIGARRPHTAGLGLETAGVALNEDGGIKVDEYLQTSVPAIYAVGDCTGGWMLSHAASSMGVVAAENAMGGKKKFPFHLIPRAVWSIPEIGAVGLSEEEGEKRGFEVETGSFPLSINGLAMARDDTAGEVKVVFDPRYGEILGIHVVGGGATEIVGEAGLLMQLEGTARELATGIRAHPTISEAVVDAAREALGWALYLPKR